MAQHTVAGALAAFWGKSDPWHDGLHGAGAPAAAQEVAPPVTTGLGQALAASCRYRAHTLSTRQPSCCAQGTCVSSTQHPSRNHTGRLSLVHHYLRLSAHKSVTPTSVSPAVSSAHSKRSVLNTRGALLRAMQALGPSSKQTLHLSGFNPPRSTGIMAQQRPGRMHHTHV